MATNPRIPEEQDQHPKLPVERKKQFPWPLIAIIVAAAILAALIVWLPKAPKAKTPPTAAQVPQQPTGNQIQLTNLKITPAPTGGAFYLDGTLVNNGSTTINGIQVELDFKNLAGQTIEKETLPVEGIVQASNPPQIQNLSAAPIQPRQTRPFRVSVTHVPAGWNQQVPEMKILTVTGSNP